MIVKRLNPESANPICVFGVADTEYGRAIEEEMRTWLEPEYNVTEIWHDGSLFEQPALHYMQELCVTRNEPCLYIHTKGAFIFRDGSVVIRNMWRREFTERKQLYFDMVNRPYPFVSCPFTGNDKTTWYNGFVTNPEAMLSHPEILPNANRFKFERLFKYSETQVVGLVRNDIDRGNASRMKEMKRHIFANYAL